MVVRAYINIPGEIFTNAFRCSYRPDYCVPDIKTQKVNYPRQQVFYCTISTKSNFASAQSTCVVETAWEYIEDINRRRFYMTLSRWKCSKPLNLWVLPFCKTACEKNNEWNEIQLNMQKLIDSSNRETLPLTEALEFISEAFAERNNKDIYYKITSALFNSLIFYEKYKSIYMDGVMYPSANTEAGINLALKKELVDKKILSCEIAIMFSVQRNPSKHKDITVVPASREVKVDIMVAYISQIFGSLKKN